jgi:hypothetical protein
MSNLAATYSALGRFQDAVVMGEKTLEFMQFMLPENHPEIGATWLRGVLIEVEVDALCFRHRNEQSCGCVLCTWAT